MLVDLRATVDAEKRAVVSAQASAEEFRLARDHQSLGDIANTLAQLTEQARVLSDGIDEARKVLKAIGSAVSALPDSPESSAV